MGCVVISSGEVAVGTFDFDYPSASIDESCGAQRCGNGLFDGYDGESGEWKCCRWLLRLPIEVFASFDRGLVTAGQRRLIGIGERGRAV